MKKFLASLLIVMFMFGNVAVLTVPTHKAEAFWGFGDISFDPPVLATNLKDLLITIGKSVLKRLANKVLNKMLKKTVNWAITGFGPYEDSGSAGQPFYVQNQESLMKNIEDQQLVKTIQELGAGCENNECPYAKDLARSLVKNSISGNKKETPVFNLDKYSSNWKAFTEEGKFSEGGGWKTFEGMYSNPQNSSFGAFLSTTTKTEEKKQEAVVSQEKELTRNDGFLSMRKCVQYADGKGKAPTSAIDFSKFTGKSGSTKTTENKDQSDTYNPETIYNSGETVFYNGREYQYIGEPDSGHAPSGGALSQKYWQNITTTSEETPKEIIEEYKSSKQYTKGNKVSSITNIFEALKDTKGNQPPFTATNNQNWKFIEKNKVGTTVGNTTGTFDDTYALPGLEVDNCLRYEVTTPGAMAKEMLGKTLTASVDKATLDSSTGNSVLDSLVDMAAVFITNGLDKLISKATTKTGDQKLYAGGIVDDPNAIYLGVGNGSATSSAWYSEDGKTEIIIQDPYDPKKLHPDLIKGMEVTKLEITQLEEFLEALRKAPEQYKDLDQCLPGPDLGWEKRLQDEFQKSSTRLNKKGSKDNNKGDRAGDAINRLEGFRDKQISYTKLAMLTVIPSAIQIISKIPQVQNVASELTTNEKKYSQRVGALATLEAIQTVLATGDLDNTTLITLKKQYAGIQRGISSEETLVDTTADKDEFLADIDINFNRSNPKSLISKCIEQRAKKDDITIGEDMGEVLFCNWQTHGVESHRTLSNLQRYAISLVATGALGGPLGNLVGFNVDNRVVATAGIETSPYDPGRYVQVLIGDLYSQSEFPFDPKEEDGKVSRDAEFSVDCNKYYTAPLTYYLDQK